MSQLGLVLGWMMMRQLMNVPHVDRLAAPETVHKMANFGFQLPLDRTAELAVNVVLLLQVRLPSLSRV